MSCCKAFAGMEPQEVQAIDHHAWIWDDLGILDDVPVALHHVLAGGPCSDLYDLRSTWAVDVYKPLIYSAHHGEVPGKGWDFFQFRAREVVNIRAPRLGVASAASWYITTATRKHCILDSCSCEKRS